jgi:hypothetical protein
MPVAGYEQAGLGRRVEWLPGMDRSTNFLERIGPFPRGFPSETSKIGQSLKRISRRGSPVWGAGFAPFAPHFVAFSLLGVALIRLGVGSTHPSVVRYKGKNETLGSVHEETAPQSEGGVER